jgi:hypothetical protein
LTLVGEKEDPLRRALPLRPPFFWMWASAVVLSILHKIDVWRVEGDRKRAKKIHKAVSSLTLWNNAP